MNGVILKQGKEKSVLQKHHWIFSGAIKSYPANFISGDIAAVYSTDGQFLGRGYFHQSQSLAGRMLSFDDRPIESVLRESLMKAVEFRKLWFADKETNSYRLVNSEGDFLPGLIVDQYGDVIVIQVNTLGMERLKQSVVALLNELVAPKAIFERSDSPSREQDGLDASVGWLSGPKQPIVKIRENGLQFFVDLEESQKTGFFLDQREMRQLVREIARGRRVLNCFAYTGGFSVAALVGGAARADSVDISAPAIELARKNVELNGYSSEVAGFFAEDVFTFLRQNTLPYDVIILDPPAFAKKRKDVPAALRGYRDINRLAMEKAPPNSFVLTSSCSYHVDDVLFQKVVFQAALQAGRNVRIISRHRHAPDHPINIYHPESDYLKSLLLYIE